MKGVRRPVLLITTVDRNTAARDGLVHLGDAHLGDRDRRGDGHDGGGDQVLRGHAHADVRAEHGAGDGREAGRHGEVQLGLGHVVDVGLDETRGLALADERRGGGDDGLGTRDVHDLEEEPGAVGLVSVAPGRTRIAGTRTSP